MLKYTCTRYINFLYEEAVRVSPGLPTLVLRQFMIYLRNTPVGTFRVMVNLYESYQIQREMTVMILV